MSDSSISNIDLKAFTNNTITQMLKGYKNYLKKCKKHARKWYHATPDAWFMHYHTTFFILHPEYKSLIPSMPLVSL